MKPFFPIALIFTALPAFAATCLTPAQIRENFRSCDKLLKMKPAEQARLLRPTGISEAKAVSSCRVSRRVGLAQSLASEKLFCAYLRSEHNPGYDGGSSGPYRAHSPLCSLSSDCRGGYCGADGSCTNGGGDSPCDNSSQCAKGYCSLGGTCS